MSNQAFNLIDQAFESGYLLEKDHDRIINLVHRDGIIDEIESKKLSELFNAIQSSKIKIVSSITEISQDISPEEKLIRDFKNQELKSLKKDAIGRDTEIAKKEALPKKSSAEMEAIEPTSVKTSLDASTPTVAEARPIEISQTGENLSHLFDIDVYNESQNKKVFHKASERMVEATVEGSLWTRTGSMVAYRGDINFRREGITEHGVAKMLKRGLTGETTALTLAEGYGKVFLADQGKKISLVKLKGIPLYIQSEHVLAFESSVKWEIQPLFNLGTAIAGGLFHLRFHGTGNLAFSSRFEPFVMRVTPDSPLVTDANATVAWSSGVIPSLRTDINFQTLIGRSSGETVQLKFQGDGIVIIQPFEEDFSKKKESPKS